MGTEAEELQKTMMSEIDRIRAERLAGQRRATLLQVAAHVAGGMMASPLSERAQMGQVAEAAVRIAELLIAAVDQSMSMSPIMMPVLQMPPGVVGG